MLHDVVSGLKWEVVKVKVQAREHSQIEIVFRTGGINMTLC
jgi:hypothetical protein